MNIFSTCFVLLTAGVYGVAMRGPSNNSTIFDTDISATKALHPAPVRYNGEGQTLTPQKNYGGWVNPEDLAPMPQCIAQQDQSTWLSTMTKCTSHRCTSWFIGCTHQQWLTQLSCLRTGFSSDVVRGYLPYCGRSVLAKAQLYHWIRDITGRTWLVDVGDANGLQDISPASLTKGYAALDVTDHAPSCLTNSDSTLFQESFQHVLASCGFTGTTQHTGNAARPWEYSASLKSMVTLDFETAGFDLTGSSLEYGEYFDKECLCSAFPIDPRIEPCSGLELAKERLWIYATCGSTSLPDNWMNKLKIIGFAYVLVEDWYRPMHITDMSKQVAELTDQCTTDACGVDLSGYCEVKRAIDRGCFCSALTVDPEKGSRSSLELTKEWLWIYATCGSASLPDNWMDGLKIIGFAYILIKDWYRPMHATDMSKQVAELTDQCTTDACEVNLSGYCEVKRAIDRGCFCSALTVNPEKGSRSDLELTKEWLWINATCGSASLPGNWTDKLKTLGSAYIPIENWHWPRCVADIPKQVIERNNQCATDACEVDSNGYCEVRRTVDRACFCRDIGYDSCGGSCKIFETRIDYVNWLHDLCGSVQNWHGLPENWRQLAAPTRLEMIPWRWTIKPSNKSNITLITRLDQSFALVNIATFLFTFILNRRAGIQRIPRWFLWYPRPGSWISKGILITALQLLANWLNAFLVHNTPGYENVSIIQLIFLWFSMPRPTWVTILLVTLQPREAMNLSAATSPLFAEMMLQILSSYYMVFTIIYGLKHKFYLGGLVRAEKRESGEWMYAGAFVWLFMGLVLVGLMLALYRLYKSMSPERTPLRRTERGDSIAYGTFSANGQSSRVSHTTVGLLQVMVIDMILLWVAQWLFWIGFIGLSYQEFSPPNLEFLTTVWIAFSFAGVAVATT